MKPHFEGESAGLISLLSDFYNLLGIKICVYDQDGEEIGYYPDRFTPFCALLRQDQAMESRCKDCDRRAIEHCRATKTGYIYSCHAGLTECIAPILINDSINGYIAIGQIRSTQEMSFTGGENKELLKQYFLEMPVIPKDKVVSALHVVQACAGYEEFKKFLYETTRSFGLRFEQYINSHIADELNIGRLMKEFRLSRAELYHSVERAFSCTPAVYIREQRLLFAYRLASETQIPVGEIADQCGIGDYNYFSKLFKKRFLQSVREVRGRRNGKKEEDFNLQG